VTDAGKAERVERQEHDDQGVGEGDRFEMAVEMRIGGVEPPEFEAQEVVGFSFGGIVIGVAGAGVVAVPQTRVPGEKRRVGLGGSEFLAMHEPQATAGGPELEEVETAIARPGIEQGVAGGQAAIAEEEIGDEEKEQKCGEEESHPL
jgi:hypothetical protein